MGSVGIYPRCVNFGGVINHPSESLIGKRSAEGCQWQRVLEILYRVRIQFV